MSAMLTITGGSIAVLCAYKWKKYNADLTNSEMFFIMGHKIKEKSLSSLGKFIYF